MDARLHAERRLRPWVKRTYATALSTLPDGSFVALDGRAWLVLGTMLLAWSTDAYREGRPRPACAEVTVLTPPSIVGVLQAGYQVGLHPSAAQFGAGGASTGRRDLADSVVNPRTSTVHVSA
jgi:hypothetical protein